MNLVSTHNALLHLEHEGLAITRSPTLHTKRGLRLTASSILAGFCCFSIDYDEGPRTEPQQPRPVSFAGTETKYKLGEMHHTLLDQLQLPVSWGASL